MKKSNFVALILGTVSGLLFALGMCMALLPEWNVFREGIIFGVTGLVLGLITFIVWRRMEHKQPIKLNPRHLLFAVFGIIGALALGLGMCFCMVWESMIPGILIGIVGIVMLVALVPLMKGIQ